MSPPRGTPLGGNSTTHPDGDFESWLGTWAYFDQDGRKYEYQVSAKGDGAVLFEEDSSPGEVVGTLRQECIAGAFGRALAGDLVVKSVGKVYGKLQLRYNSDTGRMWSSFQEQSGQPGAWVEAIRRAELASHCSRSSPTMSGSPGLPTISMSPDGVSSTASFVLSPQKAPPMFRIEKMAEVADNTGRHDEHEQEKKALLLKTMQRWAQQTRATRSTTRERVEKFEAATACFGQGTGSLGGEAKLVEQPGAQLNCLARAAPQASKHDGTREINTEVEKTMAQRQTDAIVALEFLLAQATRRQPQLLEELVQRLDDESISALGYLDGLPSHHSEGFRDLLRSVLRREPQKDAPSSSTTPSSLSLGRPSQGADTPSSTDAQHAKCGQSRSPRSVETMKFDTMPVVSHHVTPAMKASLASSAHGISRVLQCTGRVGESTSIYEPQQQRVASHQRLSPSSSRPSSPVRFRLPCQGTLPLTSRPSSPAGITSARMWRPGGEVSVGMPSTIVPCELSSQFARTTNSPHTPLCRTPGRAGPTSDQLSTNLLREVLPTTRAPQGSIPTTGSVPLLSPAPLTPPASRGAFTLATPHRLNCGQTPVGMQTVVTASSPQGPSSPPVSLNAASFVRRGAPAYPRSPVEVPAVAMRSTSCTSLIGTSPSTRRPLVPAHVDVSAPTNVLVLDPVLPPSVVSAALANPSAHVATAAERASARERIAQMPRNAEATTQRQPEASGAAVPHSHVATPAAAYVGPATPPDTKRRPLRGTNADSDDAEATCRFSSARALLQRSASWASSTGTARCGAACDSQHAGRSIARSVSHGDSGPSIQRVGNVSVIRRASSFAADGGYAEYEGSKDSWSIQARPMLASCARVSPGLQQVPPPAAVPMTPLGPAAPLLRVNSVPTLSPSSSFVGASIQRSSDISVG